MSQQEFIEKMARCAVKDMEASGILASVTTAQSILESGYGSTELAINASNYFGMKCSLSGNTWESVWDGSSKYTKRTKEQDKQGKEYEITADFRKYPDMETSVRDHSCYLNGAMNGSKKRYEGLSGEKDYKKAVQIIKDGGYATDVNYVQKVCSIIERYNLTQYDKGGNKMAKRVCIDAGHYGKYNRCPGNAAYYESEVMWKLHLMQKKYLEQMGIEVVTTRADQAKDLSLNARGSAAKGCDLFISDHSNAVGSGMNEGIDYVAVYHLVDDASVVCDDISKEFAEKIAPVIAEVMGTKQGYRIYTRKSDNDRNGDGKLNDNYYGVLHAARMVNVPGLILEHSFHTNSATVAWLLNDQNLDALAKREAECIASYLKGTEERVPEKPQEPEKPQNVMYRVQVGAYSVKANADAQLAKVKAAGFDTYMVKADGMYKIQVGAYSVKANADAMLAKVKAAGFDAFITTKAGEAAAADPAPKKISENSTVRLKEGAKDYSGKSLASFVYKRDHKVKTIEGDRVVITYDGVVVAAVHANDLILK